MLKRTFDFLIALALLIVLAPLLALLALAVGWMLGGPVLFAQIRPGLHGRPFTFYKFRTMTEARDAAGELLPDAARITPFGELVRKFSLDELPQLYNVLKGEMSLVGPRPIIEQELERYGDQVGYYLEAPPGMTGLWQISGRNDTGYEDRVALDCWYVRNWSIWYDLMILAKTAVVVFARKGAY
jgi:sugar transferase EpsL